MTKLIMVLLQNHDQNKIDIAKVLQSYDFHCDYFEKKCSLKHIFSVG
jgi:hypothetical protein